MQTLELPGQIELVELPSDWNDLDKRIVLKVLRLSMKMSSGSIDQNMMIIECFYAIAGVKRNWRSVFKERLLSPQKRHLKLANTYQIAREITSFLFLPEDTEQHEKPIELNFDSVLNFLPQLIIKGTVFLGPKDLLSDLTFGEFLEAMNNMNEYFSSKDEQHLDSFLCTLYRPANIEGIREPLTEHYRKYSKQLSKLPAEQKFCILMWFTTCIKYIKQEDLMINGSEINLSVLFPSGGSGGKRASGIGWQGLLYGIAKEGLFGDIRETYKSKLFDVLLFMYDNHYKQLKLNSKK